MKHLAFIPALLIPVCATAQDVGSHADGFSCRTHDRSEMEHWRSADPLGWARALEMRDELERRVSELEGERDRSTYVIPVVVHIIHNNGSENISDAQVKDAIRILNEDFSRNNPDWQNVRPEFLDIVADVGIEFRLAQRDPQGNCTSGITRTVSTATYVGDDSMTGLIQWPRNRYMNVWVGASANGAAGYTNYPWVFNGSPTSDGIVVENSYLGSIGTGSPGRSRVLTHEVGHWLNLQHCWGNSNEPGVESNCSMDDGVSDTPLTRGWTFCSSVGSSCGSPLDNVENYMEYSYCSKMFTEGQALRMIAALTSSVAQRSSLWQPNNLVQTGVSVPPELCAAELVANDREICAGGSVVFTDVSYNSVTGRTWSFPGGSPSTSSDDQVVVTYNEPGIFPVTLNVTDGVTSLQQNEASFIVVLPDTGSAWPASEGFESVSSLTGGPWWSVSEEGPSFVLTSSAAFSGSRSVQLTNSGLTVGHVDELISSTYDASGVSALQVSFRYAFARRQGSNTDVLRLFTSNNCGTNWVPRKTLRADTDLPTAPDQSATFVPSNADQWGYAEVTNFGAVNFVPNLRLKFQFTGGGGNALYLDDININGVPVVTSVTELSSGQATFVHPNPSTGNLQLVLDEDWQGPVTVEVFDPLGRVLDSRVLHGAGARTLPMDLSNGTPGVHLIRLSDAQRNLTLRALVMRD